MKRAKFAAGALLPALVLCSKLQSYAEAHNYCVPYNYGLPAGIMAPLQTPEACVTNEKIELGRMLFYDKRLSLNMTQSCATCHIQTMGFADGKSRSVGSTGQIHPKNALGLANVGYTKPLTWNLPELNRLDNQTLIPFFSANSQITIEELALTGQEYTIQKRLESDPGIVERFRAAFPSDPVIDIIHVARAIAVFETTLLSYQSPYDRGTMSSAAQRGERLFRSERTGCDQCHSGRDFNRDKATGQIGFHNIGLYNVGGRGDYPDQALHGLAAVRQSQGLAVATENARDKGKFRTPSLRNIAVTGPYMHDGSVGTLLEAIEVLNAGGRNIASGALAGDGRTNPLKDALIRPLGLTAEEKSDLIEFLKSLTDDCFLTDPRLSDPSQPAPKQRSYCL